MIDITDPARLAPYFTIRDSSVSLPMLADQIIIRANASRVALLVAATIGGINIRPNMAASSSVGIPVPTSWPPAIIRYSDFGAMTGAEWHAFSGSAATVYVAEVIFYPPEN